MPPLSWLITAAVGLGAATYFLYQYYLHPAWRRQRRIRRACKNAFDEGDYRLVRIRLHPNGPSGTDLLSLSPSSSSISRRYFTYRIEAADEEPDLSGLPREEVKLIRHYLNRIEKSPHYGETVLLPEHETVSVGLH